MMARRSTQVADPRNPFDPVTHRTSPYEPELVPSPLPSELKALGIYPTDSGDLKVASGEDAIQVGTRIPKAYLLAIDRLVERRVSKISSRAEFLRAAVANLVIRFADELESGRLQMTVKRLALMRATSAEAMLLHDIVEMAALVRKNAATHIGAGNEYGAVEVLRHAKRYMEEIPTGLQLGFVMKLYASLDGKTRPEHWDEDPVSRVWEKVLSGELDQDDEDELQQGVKLG